jgi:hypothetical protein
VMKSLLKDELFQFITLLFHPSQDIPRHQLLLCAILRDAAVMHGEYAIHIACSVCVTMAIVLPTYFM